MEQAVWLYVGVLIALAGLAILLQIVSSGNEQAKEVQLSNSLRQIKQKCDLICASEIDTKLSQKIVLASGAVLSGNSTGNSYCILFNQKKNCISCGCSPTDYDLNLDSEAHRQAFSLHDFDCVFEKTSGGISLECKG